MENEKSSSRIFKKVIMVADPQQIVAITLLTHTVFIVNSQMIIAIVFNIKTGIIFDEKLMKKTKVL